MLWCLSHFRRGVWQGVWLEIGSLERKQQNGMLKGSLLTTSLAEVLRLLCASAQSGELLLSAPDYEARIAVQHGRILHAACAGDTGLDALRTICGRLDVDFSFRTGAIESPGRSLEEYPSSSIIESVKSVIDYERQVARSLPRPKDIPIFQNDQLSNLDASPEEIQILLMADGVRTVADIAAETGLPIDYLTQAIARHRVAGVVTIAESGGSTNAPQKESAPTQTPKAAEPPAAGELPAKFWRGKRIS
jgi:hypothetical protein